MTVQAGPSADGAFRALALCPHVVVAIEELSAECCCSEADLWPALEALLADRLIQVNPGRRTVFLSPAGARKAGLVPARDGDYPYRWASPQELPHLRRGRAVPDQVLWYETDLLAAVPHDDARPAVQAAERASEGRHFTGLDDLADDDQETPEAIAERDEDLAERVRSEQAEAVRRALANGSGQQYIVRSLAPFAPTHLLGLDVAWPVGKPGGVCGVPACQSKRLDIFTYCLACENWGLQAIVPHDVTQAVLRSHVKRRVPEATPRKAGPGGRRKKGRRKSGRAK
jgi:hypothetical protein